MRKPALLLLWLFAPAVFAQAPAASQPPIRYHYGDNPGWANPNFDDSKWDLAKDGAWPKPAFHSDGIVWLRVRLTAPPGSAPLALALSYGSQQIYGSEFNGSEQVFAGGSLLGQRGEFPPRAQPLLLLVPEVFGLPFAPDASGRETVIALRLWCPPAARIDAGISRITIAIGPSALIRSQRRADGLTNLLSWLPSLAASALLGLLGLGLLIFWYWSRQRELLWAALLLALYPLQQFSWALPNLLSTAMSYRFWSLIQAFTDAVTMITTVEFIWTIFGLRARFLRRLLHVSWVVFNAAAIFVALSTIASATVLRVYSVEIGALDAFNLITLLLELRVLILGPRNRIIAAALAIIPIGSTLGMLHLDVSNFLGIPHVDLFEAGALLSGFVVASMLLGRAIRAWRESNALRVEYEAAREIQQQLVVEIPRVAGFHIATFYKPVTQVGGDFYGFFPDDSGGMSIVIGDVSGKGLRAAMSVSAIMGALRTIQTSSPAAMLQQLNRGLAGRLAGGFATCCIAHAHADGSLALANAGHLAPYWNGNEIQCCSGLPLGITADGDYAESIIHLGPGDTLTLVSDGIVEARNKDGELFGFDRTRAISTKSADQIAHAALTFGHQDDITVLTLTRLAVARIAPEEPPLADLSSVLNPVKP